MQKRLSEIWQHFRQTFSVEANLNPNIPTGTAVIETAKTIQQQGANLAAFKPLLENSSSLLDVLCVPLAQVVRAELPFISLAISLLKFSRGITQQYPTLEECICIVIQAAYLESIQEILSLYPLMNWDTNLNLEFVKKQLQRLNNFALDHEIATKSISCFHESTLAVVFNQVLLARLAAINITKSQANLLALRITWNTQRYITKAWLESRDIIKNAILPTCGDWQKEQQKFDDIDEYLKHHLAAKVSEPFLDQSCTIKDIYLPLKAVVVDHLGKIAEDTETIDLEKWVKTIIFNSNILEKVVFIQGDSGRGKSTFCRMFADWVRQHLHPIWTPIFINLKDINIFASRLEDTLAANLSLNFIQGNGNWLTDKNTRFLFILDGLNELQIEAKINLDLEAFIKQVAEFQEKCKNSSEMGHRVLITTRTITLQNIQNLPQNLERVEILAMDAELQQKWLNKWEALPVNQGKNTGLQQLLQSENFSSTIQKLAQEPLILYLLAAMYRDGKLAFEKLKKATPYTAKSVIYQEVLHWILIKQQDNQTDDLTVQKLEELKRIFTAAAVCVLQARGECATISTLEARLQEDGIPEKLAAESLKTALATFYFLPTTNQANRVEFFHRSFSEFLFADCLKTNLITWTQYNKTGDIKQLITPQSQLNWQIYDLLGFSGLTPEIVEYLMGLLIEIPDFPWEMLFKRLEIFYRNWCQGKLIDPAEDTLSQKKLRQLQKYGKQNLDQQQIDIYAGLNVMILLWELYHYSQKQDDLQDKIPFYPSSEPDKKSLISQLFSMINYADFMQIETFNSVFRQFLKNANFSHTHFKSADLGNSDFNHVYLGNTNFVNTDLSVSDLSRVYLSGANLSGVNLSGTNLYGANLIDAKLSGANLICANLSGTHLIDAHLNYANLNAANLLNANLKNADLNHAELSDANLKGVRFNNAILSDANLSGADLSHANLSGADLSNANLSHANLSNADLRGAKLGRTNLTNTNLENILWNFEMSVIDVQGLESVINMPEDLKQHLGLS
jgi:uncharacterized protein YjbI with pentapeptide repeats